MARTSLRLSDQVCFALYAASRAVTGLYRPMLDELGLTYPQYLVMLVLWEHRSTTVKELSATLQLDSGTLSPLLKRMEASGLVRRQRRPDDERSVEITLTDKGMALRDEARPVPGRLVRTLEISGDELVSLRALLRRITAAALPEGMENWESAGAVHGGSGSDRGRASRRGA
ncbi:MAG TPA: MarR family transcriptional regulator [Actinophytocola sp.]|uniref:MarR family winged helix-turn-helix transcriptional regulator n=1 Tax=Actinophytocola sp. TaxID=1872138 RepID=UPI002DDC92A3|nr:MarR family transcriptional regulator [Actinophytocola sp.]HEV2781240.1 MarR family transcriptional regulator [Actinophytocola sp.]